MADPNNQFQTTSHTQKTPPPPILPLYSSAFALDPVITYMLSNLPPAARLGYLPAYFRTLLTAAALNGAVFTDVADWSCAGVLVPPGRRVDNPWTMMRAGLVGVVWKLGFGGCWRMLAEYTPLSDACKIKGLRGRKEYYYLFFIATLPSEQGKGLCSALMRIYQARAQKEGVPIWLEATTAHSRDLYLKLGFEMIDEMVLGKASAAADGTACKDGEGVKIWGMIWEPEAQPVKLKS